MQPPMPTILPIFKEKFHWETEQIINIHWTSIQRAMHQLTKPECRIISKFMHEWLPFETCYHVQSMSNLQQCQSCKHNSEMVEHFIQCPHPNWQQLWDDLISTLQNSLHTVPTGMNRMASPSPRYPINNNSHSPTATIADTLQTATMLRLETTIIWPILTNMDNYNKSTRAANQSPKVHHQTHLTNMKTSIAVWYICNGHLHPTTLKSQIAFDWVVI